MSRAGKYPVEISGFIIGKKHKVKTNPILREIKHKEKPLIKALINFEKQYLILCSKFKTLLFSLFLMSKNKESP